ncbi:MAG: hypothetical protein AAGH90_10360 [Pseudomonadota bacterium]
MRILIIAGLLLNLCVACAPTDDSGPALRITVPEAPDITQLDPAEPELLPEITDVAAQKITLLRDIIERNSLARLARLADAEPAFVSNFANQSHRTHWDLLRRTGFDPIAQLETLLDGPYAIRTVGDETWYIWPDLAAIAPEDLKPERLSFRDRARLRELLGEEAVQRLSETDMGYPGVRTAIAEDGRWLYFVHESEDEANREREE